MKTIEIYQDAVQIGQIQVTDTATVDEIIAQVTAAVGADAWNRTEEIALKDLQQKINQMRDQTQRTRAMNLRDYMGIQSCLESHNIHYDIVTPDWQQSRDDGEFWTTVELVFHSRSDLDSFELHCHDLYRPIRIVLA